MAKTTTVEKNFTGSSQTGDSIFLYGNFSLSISIGSGTWTAGNVVIQRSKDNSTWHDVDSFSSTEETAGYEPVKMYYRATTDGSFNGTDVDVVLYKEGKESDTVIVY